MQALAVIDHGMPVAGSKRSGFSRKLGFVNRSNADFTGIRGEAAGKSVGTGGMKNFFIASAPGPSYLTRERSAQDLTRHQESGIPP